MRDAGPVSVWEEAWGRVLVWVRHGLRPEGGMPTRGLEDASEAAMVKRHHLAPFLGHAVPGCGGEALARQNLENLRRALARTAALAKLGGGLDEAGIPWLTVKGPVLAADWWGGVERRRAGDLDLAVAPGRVAEADAWLRGQGWRRTKPDFELTPKQWSSYVKYRHELGYVSGEDAGISVELHWRLDGVTDLEACLARPRRVFLAGRETPTLDDERNVRYLCRHGARHGWFRLFWLLDVARAFQRPDVRWAEVLPQGAEDDCFRAVAQAARLVEELLGVPTPGGLLPAASKEDRVVRWLAAEARAQMTERRSQHRAVAVWLRQLRYRVRLEQGLGWRAVAPHLHSPLNWKTLPLPDRCFWAYPVLGPFLWLVRLARRAVGSWPSREGRT